MGPADDLREALEPAVLAAGLELWDVERSPSTVRVLVDSPSGVDLTALSEVSQAVGSLLDANERMAPSGRYDLEVSSPGVERALRLPQHFQRFLGAEVALKTAEAVAGSRRLRGVLAEVGGTSIVLSTDSGPVRIDLANVQRAHNVVSWEAPAKPGRPAGRGPAQAAGSVGRGSLADVPHHSDSPPGGRLEPASTALAGTDFEDATR